MYTNSSIPTRNRALTHISLRRALRALSAQLTNLVHRLHPQISPLLHPEYSIFQRRLSHARQRVQLVWKELWRVALGGGVMGLGRRRRVAGFEMGRSGTGLEHEVLAEVRGLRLCWRGSWRSGLGL